MKSAFLSDVFHALKDREAITLPVSAAVTVWLMSVAQLARNMAHALECEAEGAITLPALRVSMAQLVGALAAATGARANLVTHEPDEAIERGFGRQPRLVTPAAEVLGFSADPNLAALVHCCGGLRNVAACPSDEARTEHCAACNLSRDRTCASLGRRIGSRLRPVCIDLAQAWLAWKRKRHRLARINILRRDAREGRPLLERCGRLGVGGQSLEGGDNDLALASSEAFSVTARFSDGHCEADQPLQRYWGARGRSAPLPSSYTTPRGTTVTVPSRPKGPRSRMEKYGASANARSNYPAIGLLPSLLPREPLRR